MEDLENILTGMVRTGTVNAVNEEKRIARVRIDNEDMDSGWLKVLDHTPKAKDESEGENTFLADAHRHHVELKPWMPETGDRVLCLYLPMFNPDGFILGKI